MGRQHASATTSPSPADRLASELQSLKSGSGLTYARLSERTHYAKSSWERWVNGKQFPPRDAVQSIASVCGGDAEHLLELWRLADSRRITFTAPGAAPAPGTTGPEAAPAHGGGPAEDADSPCPHRRQAALLRRVALLSLALGAGGVLAATGRRPFRRGA
ncbi:MULTISPECIES: helix-turn-helix domain-containing protein [Kitasatospora]|uniref:Helix-turn-helix transcriptional regulator n=1 Tax=Kitasatospora cathayae TaxID=3004092 RepID=A0ABY7PXV1_9ACTN|nr:helix-turn-helix transcriptional regulator [Kitasatospora sp. HUAS 3-15]WBP85273.1 helix-turn-helix transcriptional regulator [Kitasatospora sp. HUAS 3-15]